MASSDAQLAAEILGHEVALTLPAREGLLLVAASVAGDPPRVRAAWIDPDERCIVARIACPPGRPSRWRPVVASSVVLSGPHSPSDRLLLARSAHEARAIRPHLAGEEDERRPTAVGADGLSIVRLPPEGVVLDVDALDRRGEPIGRLVRAGIAELRTDGGTVSGRLGASHGMGAGIGRGRWAPSLPTAAFEIGYQPWLPAWVPEGLSRQSPRVEPDVAYPAAPPAVIVTWSGGGARVLLRQTPSPLASPDTGGSRAREVDVAGVRGVLRGRRLVTLVWETPDRAFGLQVRGLERGEEIALRVARSVRPENLPEPQGAEPSP